MLLYERERVQTVVRGQPQAEADEETVVTRRLCA